jgi:hypothetical protein
MSAGDFALYLSGGASNSDIDASLGGAKSSTKLAGQSVAWAGTAMSGVALVSANGNDLSTLNYGFLIFRLVGSIGNLAWAPPGHTGPYIYLPVGVNGTYTIHSDPASGYTGSITVTVTKASLPTADGSRSVNITNPARNLFANVAETDSRDGDIDRRGLYLQNDGSVTETLNIAIESNFESGARLELAWAAEGAVSQMETLPDEDTEPSGVTWSSPTLTTPLSIELTSASWIGLWLRRTVNPISRGSADPDFGLLRLWVT